jgi:hypothetical protein
MGVREWIHNVLSLLPPSSCTIATQPTSCIYIARVISWLHYEPVLAIQCPMIQLTEATRVKLSSQAGIEVGERVKHAVRMQDQSEDPDSYIPDACVGYTCLIVCLGEDWASF